MWYEKGSKTKERKRIEGVILGPVYFSFFDKSHIVVFRHIFEYGH